MDDVTTRSIHGWVRDLDALETHAFEAIDRQLGLDATSPEVGEVLVALHRRAARSRARISTRLSELHGDDGQGPAQWVIDALGAAARLVDRMRETSMARVIGDDRVLIASLLVGHQMLLTSALAVGDVATARLAELSLRDHAASAIDLDRVLPRATMDDLQAASGVTVVNGGVVHAVQAAVDRAWSAA